MEITPWVNNIGYIDVWPVLILVLMEITPWAGIDRANGLLFYSLNPCFNGNYSLSWMI